MLLFMVISLMQYNKEDDLQLQKLHFASSVFCSLTVVWPPLLYKTVYCDTYVLLIVSVDITGSPRASAVFGPIFISPFYR